MKHYNTPDSYGQPIPGVIVAGHFSEKDQYHVHRPDGMRDFLITLTLRGEGYFIASGVRQICRAGDLTILKGSVPHQYGTCRGEEWNFVWAHVSPELVETAFGAANECLILPIDNPVLRRRMFRAFKKVIADAHERRPYWHELCQNALLEILLLLKQRQTHHMDPRIEQALNLMSAQMKKPLLVAELARAVGLSSSRLSHLFKEHVGLSIVEALNRMRLDQAALLLEHTERGPMEVAYDVGFQNYNHFSQLFRKRFGMSPRVYKNGKSAGGEASGALK
ncbi:helix-turn-helix domain-containing protein [Paenibacillus hamazuiensis]|uniref:helix-turn-helix domain-containing protein n=1 Tax=Paenibacillus hamazuiensis TaxID=2936508 RepID=UPI00200E1C47|nr:helix-turn-helix domain-containing protein [Paenibacillus hamazuiensis]